MPKIQDYTGQTFNKLKVLAKTQEKTKDGNYYYLCQCECGEHIKVIGKHLKSNYIKNCKVCSGWTSPDISGQKYGNLLVINKNPEVPGVRTLWKCRCDCGQDYSTEYSNLVGNKVKSCGCKNQGKAKNRDITGQKFGSLTAISVCEKIHNKKSWLLKCDCGNETKQNESMIISNRIKSCGCEKDNNRQYLVGKRFDRLLIIKENGRQGSQILYDAVCDCGNIRTVSTGNLNQGSTRSCGCLHREISSALLKSKFGPNSYTWKGGNGGIRKTHEYTEWRRAVVKKYQGVCQVCGSNKDPEAHHLYAIAAYPDKATDVENGTILCDCCHNLFHVIYGKGDNTPEQFYEYYKHAIAGTLDLLIPGV